MSRKNGTSCVPAAADHEELLRELDPVAVGVEDVEQPIVPCSSSTVPTWTSRRRAARVGLDVVDVDRRDQALVLGGSVALADCDLGGTVVKRGRALVLVDERLGKPSTSV